MMYIGHINVTELQPFCHFCIFSIGRPFSNVARLLCKIVTWPLDLREQILNEQFVSHWRMQVTWPSHVISTYVPFRWQWCACFPLGASCRHFQVTSVHTRLIPCHHFWKQNQTENRSYKQLWRNALILLTDLIMNENAWDSMFHVHIFG